jgi:glucosamine kinase
MILIADSGSTKTDWCILEAGTAPRFFDTEGYNPYFVSTAYIVDSIGRSLPVDLDGGAVSAIYFYGAGCFADKAGVVLDALATLFPLAVCAVELDLLASARALLGRSPGFVGILGTGCNTCLYDGSRIVQNIDSLGYLLGDEGSGFYLGRKLLSDYIRGYMPSVVAQEFVERYGLSREQIMETVYTAQLPNRYCASFASFLNESVTGGEYTRGIVRQGFRDFFENLVCRYPGYRQYTFNCVGSVGDVFRRLLEEVAGGYGMRMGRVLRTPISGLVEFHAI